MDDKELIEYKHHRFVLMCNIQVLSYFHLSMCQEMDGSFFNSLSLFTQRERGEEVKSQQRKVKRKEQVLLSAVLNCR